MIASEEGCPVNSANVRLITAASRLVTKAFARAGAFAIKETATMRTRYVLHLPALGRLPLAMAGDYQTGSELSDFFSALSHTMPEQYD